MKLQQEITDRIKSSHHEILETDIKLSRPADSSHGDFTTNIALVAAKKLGKKPLDLANELKTELEGLEGVEKVEIAEPGFINFFVAKIGLLDNLSEILEKGEKYGRGGTLESKKIMLEFADPNPFKEFHIGHLRNISLGESFARLLEAQGAQVMRVNYQGDVGMHVAKALWGMRQTFDKLQLTIDQFKKKPLKERIDFLGKAYAAGAKAYEEDDPSTGSGAKKEIQEINLKVYKKDPQIIETWEEGKAWSLENFEKIYKRVGTLYERLYFESEVAERGKHLVLENIEKGIFERHEGAIVFRGENEGLHTRVFVTKEDYATYEAKDLALAGVKYRDFPYDRSIIITAHEQGPYFKVILLAMKKIEPELAEKTEHYSFGFVSLKDEKMSSRLGNIISGEWLLDEAKKKIEANFKEIEEKTAEKVAVGAVKYSMLKVTKEAGIAFSFDESISLEGNSGPYIQYTYARTQSVLAKVKSQSFDKAQDKKSKVKSTIQNSKLEQEEIEIIRMLSKFPEVVEEAGDKFAPSTLCNYLFELSQKFNLFYQKHKIIGGDSEEFRLLLTKAVGQVIKNGLYLLGIQSPEKM
ncbi:MAG: arginine--tRNA ligase [Candidatus Levyibacteriota bacterium]